MAKAKGKRKADGAPPPPEEPPVAAEEGDELTAKRRRPSPDDAPTAGAGAGDGDGDIPVDGEEDMAKYLESVPGDWRGPFFGINKVRRVHPEDKDQRTMEQLAHDVANGDPDSVEPFLRGCFPDKDPVELDPIVKASAKILQTNLTMDTSKMRPTLDTTLVGCLWAFGHVVVTVGPQRAEKQDHFDPTAEKHKIGAKDSAKQQLVAITPLVVITKEPLEGFAEYIRDYCTQTKMVPVPGAKRKGGPKSKRPMMEVKNFIMAPMFKWDPLVPGKLAASKPAFKMARPYVQSPALVCLMRIDPMSEPVVDGTLDSRGKPIEYSDHAARKWVDVNTAFEGAPVVFNTEEFSPRLDDVGKAIMAFCYRMFDCFLFTCLADDEGARRICQEQTTAYDEMVDEAAEVGWRSEDIIDLAVKTRQKTEFGHPCHSQKSTAFGGKTEARKRTAEALQKRIDDLGDVDYDVAEVGTRSFRATFPLSDTINIEPRARPGSDKVEGVPMIRLNSKGKYVFNKTAYATAYVAAIRKAAPVKERDDAYLNEAQAVATTYCRYKNGEEGAVPPESWKDEVIPVPRPLPMYLMNSRNITDMRMPVYPGALAAVRGDVNFHRKGCSLKYPRCFVVAEANEGYVGVAPRGAGAATNDMGATDEQADAVFAAMMARKKAAEERAAEFAAKHAGGGGVEEHKEPPKDEGEKDGSDEDAGAGSGIGNVGGGVVGSSFVPSSLPPKAPSMNVGEIPLSDGE